MQNLIIICLFISLTLTTPSTALASGEESSHPTSANGLHNMRTEISQVSRDFDAMLTSFRKVSREETEAEALKIAKEIYKEKNDCYTIQIQLLAKARFENPGDPAIMTLCQTVVEYWYQSRWVKIWHSNPSLAIYPELNEIIRKEIMLGRPVRCITNRCESSPPLQSSDENVDYSDLSATTP